MKRAIFFAITCLIYTTSSSQTIWGKSFGGPSSDTPTGIASDHSGNLISTGNFFQSIDLDPSEGDYILNSSNGISMFVQKLNSQGEIIWGVVFESDTSIESKAVACDSDNNIYILGQFWGNVDFNPGSGTTMIESNGKNDIFLLKLNSLGQYQWVRSYGSYLHDNPGDLVISENDEIAFVCAFQLTADLNPGTEVEEYTSQGDRDLFVQQLNTSGELIWNDVIHSDENLKAFNIEIGSNGDVYLTGDFNGSTDFDPSSNEFEISPQENSSNFLLSLNNSGVFQWVNIYESTTLISAIDISVNSTDDLYLLMNNVGSTDLDPGINELPFSTTAMAMVIQKYSSDGTLLWSKEFESFDNGSMNGKTIITDSESSLVVSGEFYGIIDFDPNDGEFNIESEGDIYILSLTLDGEFVFVHNFESTNYGGPTEAIFTQSNSFYLLGVFTDSMNVQIGSEEEYIYAINSQDCFIINVGYALGIGDKLNSEHLSIYPNPFIDGIYFENDNDTSESLRIYSLNGTLINQYIIEPTTNYLDLSSLNCGVYFFEFRVNGIKMVKKIIKI